MRSLRSLQPAASKEGGPSPARSDPGLSKPRLTFAIGMTALQRSHAHRGNRRIRSSPSLLQPSVATTLPSRTVGPRRSASTRIRTRSPHPPAQPKPRQSSSPTTARGGDFLTPGTRDGHTTMRSPPTNPRPTTSHQLHRSSDRNPTREAGGSSNRIKLRRSSSAGDIHDLEQFQRSLQLADPVLPDLHLPALNRPPLEGGHGRSGKTPPPPPPLERTSSRSSRRALVRQRQL
jgi:hypothetical protein